MRIDPISSVLIRQILDAVLNIEASYRIKGELIVCVFFKKHTNYISFAGSGDSKAETRRINIKFMSVVAHGETERD